MAADFFEFSDHAARRMAERGIKPEWIAQALASPDRLLTDELDPALRHALKKIAEMDNRVLRVVYNPTVEPPRIVSAHFDRRMREEL